MKAKQFLVIFCAYLQSCWTLSGFDKINLITVAANPERVESSTVFENQPKKSQLFQ